MPATVEALIIPGWMERNEAIAFLQNVCWFDPPLTDQQAEALWLPYRSRVEALPSRNIQSPARLPIEAADQQHVANFLGRLRGPEVLDVIRVNLLGLVVYQNYVVTDKADEHARSAGRWCEKFLVIDRPVAQLPGRMENGVLKLTLPHGEHMLQIQPDGAFRVGQFAGFVCVAEIQGRLFLKAGYHRSFAFVRSVKNAPDANATSVVVALTATLPPQLSSNFPQTQGLRTVVLGSRPPLFSDFFDSDFAMPVKLRKKRYEAHISILAIDEP